MGWDKGRYYTRSKKVNGRVVREYHGTGRVAELSAQMDAIKREQRLVERANRQMEKAELDSLEDSISEIDRTAEQLARAALIVCGFRQHHRSEWRKKRGNSKPA